MSFNVRDGHGTARHDFLLPDLVTQQTRWNSCDAVWCTANAQAWTQVCTCKHVQHVHLHFMRFGISAHFKHWLLGWWYTCSLPLCTHTVDSWLPHKQMFVYLPVCFTCTWRIKIRVLANTKISSLTLSDFAPRKHNYMLYLFLFKLFLVC